MKNIFYLLITVFICSAQASDYTYHPSSPMYLSGGFNPYKPTEAYLECIDHDGIKSLDTPSNQNLTITIDTVKSRHDLYSKTDMSASVSGSYGPFSGSASINKLDEITFNENDFNWIIVLKSDMGKYGLKNPRLNNSLSNLPSMQLFSRCGSEIVTQERRGVMLYAFISVHNLSQSERHEMESTIGGGFNNTAFSAAASAKYRSILQFSYAVGTVSIRIQAQGGEGLSKLADIIGGGENNFANYGRLPDIVNDYVKSFNPSNAVPLQYFTTSLNAFKTGLPARFGDFQSALVGQLYEKYLDSLKTIQKVDSLLSPNNTNDINITDNDRKSLETVREVYQGNLEKLYAAGRLCFDDKSNCLLPKINDVRVNWPKGDINKICSNKRDDALVKGYYPLNYYEMARKRDLVPIIGHINNTIGIIGYGECMREF